MESNLDTERSVGHRYEFLRSRERSLNVREELGEGGEECSGVEGKRRISKNEKRRSGEGRVTVG